MPSLPIMKNRILGRLPDAELMGLLPHMEPIELPLGYCIVPVRHEFKYVYFPESGICSIIAVSPTGRKVESGMFGREGFGPTAAAVGVGFSHQDILIQSAGKGFRIPLEPFWERLEQSPALMGLLVRFAYNLATQASYTALSNRIHRVEVRLARWLLMCHDRLSEDHIGITQEYIALMLAIRRPSVTTALHILEGKGLIRSNRKLVTIRNRRSLEVFAFDAYGEPEEEYRHLFGNLSSGDTMEQVSYSWRSGGIIA